MSFKIGARVRLNSGGPMMTVEAVEGNSATCVWFDKATLKRALFSTDILDEPAQLDELLKTLKQEDDKGCAR